MEQSLNYVEVGAFCGEECRGAELPIELVGEQMYFLTIQGETNDVITFWLWDHQSNEELDYVCEQTYIFVADDVISEYPDWYPIHFTAPIIYHEVTATVNPVEGGTVTGVGIYTQGTTATLTATANEGYTFVNWTENGEVVSTDNPYSFTVNGATMPPTLDNGAFDNVPVSIPVYVPCSSLEAYQNYNNTGTSWGGFTNIHDLCENPLCMAPTNVEVTSTKPQNGYNGFTFSFTSGHEEQAL